METTGTITNILPLQSGTGKSGNEWKRQDIIIQTEDNYPKTICVSLWGDMVSKGLKQGDKAQFHFNLESREFNGKWYRVSSKTLCLEKNTYLSASLIPLSYVSRINTLCTARRNS